MQPGEDGSRGTPDIQQRSDRRSFLVKASAVCLGGMAIVPPLVAGALVILAPLRRNRSSSGFVRVTSLNSLPETGLPRKFTVIANHVDAWTRNASVPVGAIYLRRTGPNSVIAFNVVCPHAGCFVDFVPARQGFLCPCHNSSFALNGKVNDPRSPSPRGLDQLEVEIRNGTEVWVKYQEFVAGHEKKIPVA